MESDLKEKDQEICELKEENKQLKVSQKLVITKYEQWEHNKICDWITILDNGDL